MIPASFLNQTVDVVTPDAATTDDYNNPVVDYGTPAARISIKCWLQQDARTEKFPDGRNPQEEHWLMITNHQQITTTDRVEWAAHPAGPATFEVWGPPEHAYTPAGHHHLEIGLRRLTG